MLDTDFVSTQVKQIGHCSVDTQESLSLLDRFEPSHSSLAS